MSGPQVAGILCLLLSVNPQLTPAELKTLVHSLCTTDKIYDPADGNFANWRNLNPGSTPKRFFVQSLYRCECIDNNYLKMNINN